ncbi:MAG: methyl-accepting chemotaxis protein [Pirellulales bacterium]
MADAVASGCTESKEVCLTTKQILDESVNSLQSVLETLSHLVSSTTSVQDAVETIEGFAKQTALLAINASIEAARA